MGTHFWTPETVGKVQIIGPDGEPVNPTPVIEIVDGGDIDTSTLSKETTQQQVLSELQGINSAQSASRNVQVTNTEMPLPEGAATQADQQLQTNRLAAIQAILGSQLSVVLENDEALNVAVASLPLPAGASTAAKQDALIAALAGNLSTTVTNTVNTLVTSLPAIQIAPNQSLSVTGSVSVSNFPATQPVSGSVAVSNFPATTAVSGIATPVAVTDNGASLTVDGAVNLTAPVEVSNFPTSTQVSNFPATQAVTQSGTWNVGARDSSGALVNALTEAPATDARGLVTRNIPSGTQAVSGTVNAAVSNFPATQAVSLTSVPTHPVTQSGTWTVTSNPAAPSPTGTALTAYRNAALTNTAQVVKASAGRVLNYHLANMNSSAVYVHFYNAASGVTVGTTTPLVTLAVPANSVLDGAWVFSFGFSNGIMMAATTGAANATAPTSGILTMIGYV